MQDLARSWRVRPIEASTIIARCHPGLESLVTDTPPRAAALPRPRSQAAARRTVPGRASARARGRYAGAGLCELRHQSGRAYRGDRRGRRVAAARGVDESARLAALPGAAGTRRLPRDPRWLSARARVGAPGQRAAGGFRRRQRGHRALEGGARRGDTARGRRRQREPGPAPFRTRLRSTGSRSTS